MSLPDPHVFFWWISSFSGYQWVSHRPVYLSMLLRKCWLSSLLNYVLHSYSRDEPIWLSLIVVPHMILAEESELLFVVQLQTHQPYLFQAVEVIVHMAFRPVAFQRRSYRSAVSAHLCLGELHRLNQSADVHCHLSIVDAYSIRPQ